MQLFTCSNPLGWVYVEYTKGKALLAEHFDLSLFKGRKDVKVNAHGVVQFYSAGVAKLFMTKANTKATTTMKGAAK